jgi:predicted PurR-regulated permease PerM
MSRATFFFINLLGDVPNTLLASRDREELKYNIIKNIAFVATFFGGVFSLIVIIIITYYLSLYNQPMKRKIRSFLPAKYQPYFSHLVARMQDKIGLWLRGQLMLCLIIFFMVLIGLSLLGVKYVWVLALLAGLSEIIPYFGPIIGAVPAVFIAFTQSPELGLATLVLYFFIQQSENYLIVPKVMQKAVGLNPVVIIIAMLIGAQVAGVFGILLAVPVTTALSVAFNDFMLHRQRGFDVSKALEE